MFRLLSVGIAMQCVFILCWLSVKLSHFRVWKLPWSQISIVSVKNKYKFELCFSSPTGRSHTEPENDSFVSPIFDTKSTRFVHINSFLYYFNLNRSVYVRCASWGVTRRMTHLENAPIFLKRESFWCNLPDDLHQTVSCADLKVIILIERN